MDSISFHDKQNNTFFFIYIFRLPNFQERIVTHSQHQQ
jgi:hypothetical protein